MFYSECKVCGKVRRWLDKEEVKDPKIVADNMHRPLLQKEYDAVDKENVLSIYCLEHAPKEKKKSKKKKAEEVEA